MNKLESLIRKTQIMIKKDLILEYQVKAENATVSKTVIIKTVKFLSKKPLTFIKAFVTSYHPYIPIERTMLSKAFELHELRNQVILRKISYSEYVVKSYEYCFNN